jgi:high-affinity iron transporter
MTQSALILLREGLEAALIAAIVFAYLRKLDRRDRFGPVWLGVAAGTAITLVVGVALFLTVGSLEGDARTLTFALIMLTASGVLTWMVFWMRKQARAMKGDLQHKVDVALVAGSTIALAAVVFFGMLREGLETVLFFLAAAGQSSTLESLVGGTIGLVGAIVLAYAFYRGASWLNLRTFFAVSGGLLLLFAAGLLARGVAELQILGALPTFWYPVFDLAAIDPLSTESAFGQFLRGLFGWDPAPSIEEIAVWVGYLAIVGTFYLRGLAPAPKKAPERSRPAAPPAAAAEPAERAG